MHLSIPGMHAIILQMSLTCWVKLEPKFYAQILHQCLVSSSWSEQTKLDQCEHPKQKSENSRLPTCSNFAHCMHADHQIFLSWLPNPKWVTTHSTQMVSLCVDKKQQTLSWCCFFFFFFIFFLSSSSSSSSLSSSENSRTTDYMHIRLMDTAVVVKESPP